MTTRSPNHELSGLPEFPLILRGSCANELPTTTLSDAFCILSVGLNALRETGDVPYVSVGNRFIADLTPLTTPPVVPDDRVRAYLYTGGIQFDTDTDLRITVRRMLSCPASVDGLTDLETTFRFETRSGMPDYAAWVDTQHAFRTPEGTPDPQGEAAYMRTLPATSREAAAVSYSFDQVVQSAYIVQHD